MSILGAITGISAAIGVGSSLIGAVQGNNIGKAEAKAAKKQAKLQLESTKAEASYAYRTTVEQVDFEEAATAEKTNLEANQARAKAAMEATQQGAKLGLDLKQAEGDAARDYARIEAAIYQNRQLSAIKQGQQARAARTSAERSKAIALQSGVGVEGSAGQVIRQSSIMAEYDRLVGNYEVELGVRGLRLDQASVIAKARDAREQTSLAVDQLNESVALTYAQIGESADMTLRQSSAGAAMARRNAAEARDLQIKYAEIGAKFEIDTAGDRYSQLKSNLIQQLPVNIGASILGAATQGYQLGLFR